jgi:hypothetical protein
MLPKNESLDIENMTIMFGYEFRDKTSFSSAVYLGLLLSGFFSGDDNLSFEKPGVTLGLTLNKYFKVGQVKIFGCLC